jgi:hypothetical protein
MYGSQADVIALTGVEYADLGCSDDEALQTLLGVWLTQAKSLIDAECAMDFEAEVVAGTLAAVPPAVVNVAIRLVANMVAVSLQRRKSPLVQMGQFNVQISADDVFTEALRRDLKPFRKRKRLGLYVVGKPDEEETV